MRASRADQDAGFAEQSKILLYLQHCSSPDWEDARTKLCHEMFGVDETRLTPSEKGKLSFAEKVSGDLRSARLATSLEIQCSPKWPNCVWVLSKYHYSEAEWQCFSFSDGNRLVISSNIIRQYIDENYVTPTEADDGEDYFLFGQDWLRKQGAEPIEEWVKMIGAAHENCIHGT